MGKIAIPGEDQGKIHVVDFAGRQIEARHGLTNAILRSFRYDATVRLAAIVDAD